MLRREWLWAFGALLTAAALGMTLPLFVSAVRVAGRHVPQDRIEYDYLVALVWATAIAVSIRFWPVAASDKRPLVLIWIAKTFVTLVAMLAYEWNYNLDAYGYFRRSLLPEMPLSGSAWHRGGDTIASFAWIHGQVLPDSYHALKVTFALVGLLAIYLIYRGAVHFRGVEDRRLLYVLALFPSTLFWSSIVGKDPMHLLGIALYCYGVLAWRSTGRLTHVMTLVAGAALAFVIRSWSGPILLFPLLVFAVTGLRRPWMRVVFSTLALVAFGLTVSQFAATFNIETLQDVQSVAEARARGWEGGSAQERSERFTSIRSMLAFAPIGAFSALFRPLPGEVRNPFGLLAGMENLALLGLLAIAVFRFRLARLRDPAILWAVALVLTWSFVYSFVSYYNFGAAVRFRLQILPMLLLLLLHFAFGARQRIDPAGVARPPAA